jgi:DNA-binding HxlR family transcriptional regulator
MEENHLFWPLAHEVLRALGQQYYPVMEDRAREAGLGDFDWYLLLPCLTFDPEPVSAQKLLVRVPYYSAYVYENRLKELAEAGYLKEVSAQKEKGGYPAFEYNLTESGRMTIQWIIQAADVAMLSLHPMSLENLERLAGFLRRLMESSLHAEEPPEKWALTLSRKTDHASVAPVVVRIDQYLTDLNAYRDDCRLAAWQLDPQTGDVSPPAWEVFTFIWRVDRNKESAGYTLDQLANMLERRGHPRRVYAEALKELDKKGWVHAEGKIHCLTSAGREVREQARQRTDMYFYRPWAVLSATELGVLRELLVEMWDGLKYRLANGKKA